MQIIFTSDNTFLARAIRYFTKRSWLKSARVSHVAIRLGDHDSNWMVEATPHNGFSPNWWPKFLRTSKVSFIFEMLDCPEDKLNECMEEFINDNIWDPYDLLDILGMLMAIIWYWITGKRIKNTIRTEKYMTCTESTYQFMQLIFARTGIRFFKDRDPSIIFPEDLLIECENNPDKFKAVSLDF